MEIYKAEIKDRFENPIGQEFYTYYLQESNRGTRFNVDTGVFKVKIIKERPSSVFMKYDYEIVEILGKPTKSVSENLLYYINSFHAQSANVLFTTLEEAVKSHDNVIKKMIKNPRCNADELNLLYKKLIVSPDEIDLAKMWYESLDPIHKRYLKLLK